MTTQTPTPTGTEPGKPRSSRFDAATAVVALLALAVAVMLVGRLQEHLGLDGAARTLLWLGGAVLPLAVIGAMTRPAARD